MNWRDFLPAGIAFLIDESLGSTDVHAGAIKDVLDSGKAALRNGHLEIAGTAVASAYEQLGVRGSCKDAYSGRYRGLLLCQLKALDESIRDCAGYGSSSVL